MSPIGVFWRLCALAGFPWLSAIPNVWAYWSQHPDPLRRFVFVGVFVAAFFVYVKIFSLFARQFANKHAFKLELQKLLDAARSNNTSAGDRGTQKAPDTDTAFERLSTLLKRYQDRLDAEYTDMSSRTAWLMTGQAFLLSTFLTALNANFRSHDWLAMGVSVSGAFASFVLALSTFVGYGFIEALKENRDTIETRMQNDFAMPRLGIAVGSNGHLLGLAATRYLPIYAYVAWTALTIFVLHHLASATGSGAINNIGRF